MSSAVVFRDRWPLKAFRRSQLTRSVGLGAEDASGGSYNGVSTPRVSQDTEIAVVQLTRMMVEQANFQRCA